MKPNRLVSACVLAIALAIPSAGAAHTDLEKAEAQARFDEGLKLHDAGNENEARLKFIEAWAVLKRPNVLYNLARSEQLTSHLVDALDHFEEFVLIPEVSTQDKAEAGARIVELRKIVGRVEIQNAPEGARIFIDDKWTGKLAPVAAVHALPGRHVVEARLSTRKFSRVVECVAQKTTVVDFGDDARTTAPDARTTAPDAQATSPDVRQPVETERTYAGGRIPVVVALGVLGAGGLALGAGLGVASSSKRDEIAQLYGNSGACASQTSASCAPVLAARSDQSTLATASVIGYVAGGALLAGGVLAFFLWPKKEAPTVGFFATPAGGAVTLHGRF